MHLTGVKMRKSKSQGEREREREIDRNKTAGFKGGGTKKSLTS